MNAETLKIYGPCRIHLVWHDLTVECFECVCLRRFWNSRIPEERLDEQVPERQDRD